MTERFVGMLLYFSLVLSGVQFLTQGKSLTRETKNIVKRVSEGDNVTSIEDAPFMAMILTPQNNSQKKFLCGSTLISKQHILTAAHCILNNTDQYRFDFKDIEVRLGELDRNSTDESNHMDLQVLETIIYPDYNFTSEHDIAILKLERPLELNAKINIACLPPNDTFDNREAYLYGWGEQYIKPSFTNLLTMPAKVIPNDECQIHLRNLNDTTVILENQICAGENRRNGCRGDSGGPLIIQRDPDRPIIIGVLSSGRRCGQEFPNIYARITSYKDWILKYVTDFCEN